MPKQIEAKPRTATQAALEGDPTTATDAAQPELTDAEKAKAADQEAMIYASEEPLKKRLSSMLTACKRHERSTVITLAPSILLYCEERHKPGSNAPAVTMKELRTHCYDLAKYKRKDEVSGRPTVVASFENAVTNAIKAAIIVFSADKTGGMFGVKQDDGTVLPFTAKDIMAEKQPKGLDMRKLALFAPYNRIEPMVRVIGADGKPGPEIENRDDTLVQMSVAYTDVLYTRLVGTNVNKRQARNKGDLTSKMSEALSDDAKVASEAIAKLAEDEQSKLVAAIPAAACFDRVVKIIRQMKQNKTMLQDYADQVALLVAEIADLEDTTGEDFGIEKPQSDGKALAAATS